MKKSIPLIMLVTAAAIAARALFAAAAPVTPAAATETPKEAAGASFTADEKTPSNLKASADGMKVVLSWEGPGNEYSYYNVYRSTSDAGDLVKLNKAPLEKTSFTDARGQSEYPPKHNTPYYYIVKAFNGTDESGASAAAQAKPFGPLAPPSDLGATAKDTSVVLKWSAPESSGENPVSFYEIFRGLVPSGGEKVTRTAAVKTEFTDDADGKGLTKGVRYYYWAQSVDEKGAVSQQAGPVSGVPFSGISAPKNVTISPVSSESIKVIWDAPETQGTFGVEGYNIFRSSVSQSDFPASPVNEKLIKPHQDSAGKLFYFDNIVNSEKAPEPGVQYYYRVVPVDSAGNTGEAAAVTGGKIEYMKIEKSGILSADISEYGLPPDSKLKLAGLKTIEFKFETTIYDQDISGRNQVRPEPKIEQPLRLDLNGNIGSKIFVDIHYDDNESINTDQQKKISIQYKGDKAEALQELSFGDINFEMPPLRYVRPLASLFGIKGKAAFFDDKLKLTAAWAQTKGITESQTFDGRTRRIQTNGRDGITINDTNFISNTYYYLTKDVAKVTALDTYPAAVEYKIEPGSVKIYTDDRNISTNNPNTVKTADGAFYLDKVELGSGYTVDYNTGVVKFNFGIPNNVVIAVAYKITDGTSIIDTVGYAADGVNFDFSGAGMTSASDGVTTNSARLIKAEGTDISHMVMNYYYMGATQINSPGADEKFVIKILDNNNNAAASVPLPSQTGYENYYQIDAEAGIIKFKSFYPFSSLPGATIEYPGVSSISGNESDAYNVNRASAVSKYKIYFEYSYNISTYRLDYSPVILNSEKVMLGGRLLKRDTDYRILYESGDIVFINSNDINPDTTITVVYEYTPFIASSDSAVYGLRLDYTPFENLNLGATAVKKDATKSREPPDARSTELSLSTPFSGLVADANVNFTVKKEDVNYILSSLPLFGKTDLPVDVKFEAEYAFSDLNANTYDFNGEKGIAMIDNMESTDSERSLSMVYTSWFPASMASDMPEAAKAGRIFAERETVDVAGHEKTSTDAYSTGLVKALKLKYGGLTDQKWDSLRYNFSSSGENLHAYSYLEMWVRVRTDKPIQMSVDLGLISEDSNGNNRFEYNTDTVLRDSEDILVADKADDKLVDGEDKGISPGAFTWLSSPAKYWGDGNDVLDTEDMNRSGNLDTAEKYYRYGAVAAPGYISHPGMSFTDRDEWVNIRIPLKDVSALMDITGDEANPVKTQFLSNIKHIRINLKGAGSSPATGTIEIESVKFIGNSWMLAVPTPGITDGAGNLIDSPDTNKFDAYTVKGSTDPSYVPQLSLFEWTTANDKLLEEALKISYSLSSYDLYNGSSPIYYVKKPFNASSGYDYRSYKYLKVDIFCKKKDGDAGPGRLFFIRLGQDASNENLSFFQYNEQLDNIPQDNSWHTVVFRIDGSDKKRSEPLYEPNLRQVNIVTIGFINPNTQAATEEYYINNIRLTDPEPRQGQAVYAATTLNIAGIGSVRHEYEDRQTDFNTIEDLTRSQIRRHSSANRVWFTPTFLPFLTGFTNSYSRTQEYMEDKYKNDPSYTANLTVPDSDIEKYDSVFGFNLIPNLSFSNNISYSRQKDTYYQVTYTVSQYQSNRVDKAIWQPAASWTAPTQFFFIPLGTNRFQTNFELNYFRQDYFGSDTVSYRDNWNQNFRQRYRWEGSYDIWKFSIAPVYEYVLQDGKGNQGGYTYYNLTQTSGYTADDLVLYRQILPSLTLRINDAWIFSPSVTYMTTYRQDFSSSQISTSGKLAFSSGLSLGKLLSFLPNITGYSFSVDTNETFDNRDDPKAFENYENLTFERKWNAFLWKMLYDENEMRALESISLRSTINLKHSISLDTINVFDIFSFNPSLTYQTDRFSYSKTLQEPKENWYLSLGTVTIKNITLPYLEFLVKNQSVSMYYNFSRERTISNVTKYRNTHSGNGQLNFANAELGLTGNLAFSMNAMESRDGLKMSDSFSMTPSLTFGYMLKKEDPFTVWDWVPGIGGKVFKFDQNLNLTLTLGLSFTSSFTDYDINNKPEEPDVNKVSFSSALTGTYNVLQNLKMTGGLTYRRDVDFRDKTNSLNFIGISVRGDLEF